MAGTPKIRVKKYFGSAAIEESVLNLDEARSFLSYFWTKDGGSHIKVAVEGQSIKSFEELAAIATEECRQNNAFLDVGLYLSPKQG